MVNNVETLINVLPIVLEGGPAYAADRHRALHRARSCSASPARSSSPAPTRFRSAPRCASCSSWRAASPKHLRTVLLGGAAGSFVTPDDLDLKLTFEDAREAATTLGSGVVLVIDDQIDVPELLLTIAAFMRDESCGQCVPCRVGTVRQEEALARLVSGRTRGTVQDELNLIAEIGQAMRDASICGLGQTASSAVESAIARLNVFTSNGNGGSTA